MISQKIVVVDDDPKVRLLLRRCLEEGGLLRGIGYLFTADVQTS